VSGTKWLDQFGFFFGTDDSLGLIRRSLKARRRIGVGAARITML
jgi:hypothetical protein